MSPQSLNKIKDGTSVKVIPSKVFDSSLTRHRGRKVIPYLASGRLLCLTGCHQESALNYGDWAEPVHERGATDTLCVHHSGQEDRLQELCAWGNECLIFPFQIMPPGPSQENGVFHQERCGLMFKTVVCLVNVSIILQFCAWCSKLISLKKVVTSGTGALSYRELEKYMQ